MGGVLLRTASGDARSAKIYDFFYLKTVPAQKHNIFATKDASLFKFWPYQDDTFLIPCYSNSVKQMQLTIFCF